jgi:hypothetical protein
VGHTRHRKKIPNNDRSPYKNKRFVVITRNTEQKPPKRVMTTRRPQGLSTAVESGGNIKKRRRTSLESACPTEDDRKSQI